MGFEALTSETTGNHNTAIGTRALGFCTFSDSATAVGYNAGINVTSSDFHVLLGAGADILNDTCSNCIVIQSNIGGGGTYANTADQIRIGFGDTASTSCFIDGIRGRTTGVADAIAVLVDSAGQLGTVSSSRRYKENIQTIGDISNNFMQLNPVEFTYKSDDSHTTQYGLIAEEVEPLFPELVVYNKEGDVETVKYHLLDALYIKMIQDLQRTVDQLQQQVAQDQLRIAALENAHT